jgi:hypothetical protein
LPAQECTGKNSTFKPGEELTYTASYSWFIVFTEVAEAKLKIADTTYNNIPSYKITATGNTYKNWDWIFKVRDKFETTIHKNTLRPLIARRHIREGNYRQNDFYIYNHDDTVAYARNKTNDNPTTLDTIKFTPCTFDIMSALLYARNIDFDSHKAGDEIPITILLDKELYPIYIKYLGIEEIKVKGIGKFECIKFSVMLIAGETFKEGDYMTVWATNDKNKIVVFAEAPIIIGSVKVRIAEVKNNRYPFTSLRK